jgi:hypothetical protein
LLYATQFRRSSAVEQLTVNQLVVGSIPTAGANKIKDLPANRPAIAGLFYFRGNVRGTGAYKRNQ